MRFDVKKYLFIGFKGDRDRFFEKAQDLGVIHFIEKTAIKTGPVSGDIQDIISALKILRGLPSVEQEEVEEFALADGLVQKIVSLKETKENLAEQARILNLEKSRVAIFGDFSWDEIHQIEAEMHRKVQFYFAKSGYAEQVEFPDELIYVGSDHALDYFMGFNKAQRQYPKMQEILVQHPIGEVTELHKKTVESLRKTEQRLKTYAKYNDFLHQALIMKLDGQHLQEAEGQVNFEIEGKLFAIEGWVPVNKIAELEPLVKDLNVHAEEVAIEQTDAIPTYLENRGVGRVGEDLVHVYDTPSRSDKDPSLWVLFFFSLFFALIIGDAGYGMIFLAVALYVRYKYKMKGLGKRMVSLLLILGASCVFWGVLSNNFFGINLSMENPLRKISLVQWLVQKKAAYHIAQKDDVWQEWVKELSQLQTIKDPVRFLKEGAKEENGQKKQVIYEKFADNVMFELALFIGVLHISFSIIRNLYRNWMGVGWLFFIVGCYLYFPFFLNATSLIHYVFGVSKESAPQNGLYLIVGGAGLATLIALYKHKVMGIMEPMHGIQIFSDTMSYLRLYALGLAGAMLALVINGMASSAPFVVGIVILLFGHGVNILLSIMSGVIHGLRLNYLEWYHYSFEGDGKRFNPLRKLNEEN